MLLCGNVLVNCIILEYECTVKDNVGGDEDGHGLHPGHLNLFRVIYFGSRGECDLSGP